MPAVMTYTSLVSDILTYCEKPNDADLIAEIPRLVMYAENRIAAELKLQGFISVVSGNFTPSDPTLPKPAYWRDTVAMNYVDATGRRQQLYLRTYEFCSQYWPNRSATGAPKYYSDYDALHFFLVPTPPSGLLFELHHHVRLQPLDSSNQVNYMTDNLPQLLFQACMKEAQLLLRNDVGASRWESAYQASLGALDRENSGRLVDRATVPKP